MTPSEIEPATFRLVVQCLKLRHRVPPHPPPSFKVDILYLTECSGEGFWVTKQHIGFDTTLYCPFSIHRCSAN